jgi:uncharacterized protein
LYYTDTGLLHLQRSNLYDEMGQPSFGFIFQNYIYNQLSHLVKNEYIDIKYWRTKDHSEVDFVLDVKRKIIPIEVKFQEFKSPKIERSLKNFILKYAPTEAFVITKNYTGELIIDKTIVYFLPYWQLDKIMELAVNTR